MHRRIAQLALSAALVLIASAPSAAPHASAQVGVAAEPPAVSVSLPLGEQISRTIRLSGPGTPFSPAVYEAQEVPTRSLAAGPAQVALPKQSQRLDATIADKAAANGQTDFLVFLRDQADLSAAYGIRDWAARGRYVYTALTAHAERTQGALRADLAARRLAYEPLWIVNAVRVRGTTADAAALAGRAEVALLRASRTFAVPPPVAPQATTAADDRCSPDAPGNPVCWNIRHIGADRAWSDFGVDGGGVTVANLDTGVSFRHAALASSYRGNLGGGRLDHSYSWYDPQGSQQAPADTNGHGTHTMGTIAGQGDGTASQPSVGVAPGARWIAAQGCDGFLCSEFDLMSAAQWLLAPTDLSGQNPRPDLRPMIVNNSWGGAGGNDWYAGYTAAWRAAGIFPVFAAGNAESSRPQACGTISSPGDYADVVAVGATDRDDRVTSFSLLGPTADGRTKPDVTAPGAYTTSQIGIMSASITDNTSYRALQGTSMATPHVAGLVALLWSANPALVGDYDATYALLRETAVGISDTRCGGAPGTPNNIYGAGRIDAYTAVARARVDVPWLIVPPGGPTLAADGSATLNVTLAADRVPGPGTYRARLQVFSGDLGQAPTTVEVVMNVAPIAGAAVVSGRVLSQEGGPVAATVGVEGGLGTPTDSAGNYTLTLKPGSHTLAASALSYMPGRRAVSAASGANSGQDIVLPPDQARVSVATQTLSANLTFGNDQYVAVPLANTGTRTLYYTAETPADRFSLWRSDSGEPGAPAYSWVDLPPEAPALTLGADGFAEEIPLGLSFPLYSYVLTETLVTADGMLSFDTPYGYRGPSSRCLPADELGFYTIAPLRADLDPSRGGAVRYGTVNSGQTFVLSYEGVPRDDGPAGETYTFQALLHNDGRVVFQYKELAQTTTAMSIGIQRTPWDFQQIGCGGTLPVHDGLAIELRPQVSSAAWMQVEPAEGALAPGQQAELRLRLSWARPSAPGPYRGQIRLSSNDPLRPAVSVPVEVSIAPAPHEYALPTVRR
jgi:subtilisin family serine protease